MKTTAFIELEISIEFDHHGPCRGSREHGTGLALEPDEPESVEITSVKTQGGTPLNMDELDMDALESECLSAVADAKDASEESKAEDRAERFREARLE